MGLRSAVALTLLACAGPAPLRAEEATELPTKVTLSAYVSAGETNFDLNVRRKFGNLVAWVGDFVAPHGEDQGRLGAEYDYQRGVALVVPTVQVGTNGLVAGQLYSELGGRVYAIAGYSRTNLKPFFNLSWDPNESLQLGAGGHLGADRLYGWVIFDVRLHTGQQSTHLLWRHPLGHDRLTVDALYKSGRTDEGRDVHAAGLSLAYDRRAVFVRAAYDPYVNFSADHMVRLGAGFRF